MFLIRKRKGNLILIICIFDSCLGFSGISNFLSYLTPNPVDAYIWFVSKYSYGQTVSLANNSI